MEQGKLVAHVQYGDFIGSVSADARDHWDLQEILERFAFDPTKQFAFGLDIYIGETAGDATEKALVYLLVVEVDTIGEGSISAIQDYANSHYGKVPYRRIDLNIDLNDLLRYFKRTNLVLLYKGLQDIQEFEQIDS